MKKYIVEAEEHESVKYFTTYEVEANSLEEARENHNAGLSIEVSKFEIKSNRTDSYIENIQEK